MENFGGRKFVMSVILIIAMMIMTLFGKLATDAFVNFVELIAGMYLGANVVAKFAGAKK